MLWYVFIVILMALLLPHKPIADYLLDLINRSIHYRQSGTRFQPQITIILPNHAMVSVFD